MNGSGTPVNGIALLTEPILISACQPIQTVMPIASNVP